MLWVFPAGAVSAAGAAVSAAAGATGGAAVAGAAAAAAIPAAIAVPVIISLTRMALQLRSYSIELSEDDARVLTALKHNEHSRSIGCF